ncbi:ATP-binding protein [Heliophilum fasciatum]|uniref:Transitional endoplasmic reticulum ATPase n=1 Tax=Heliophilum fasciatum TaxID=35700 RepID=A0A4R2RYN0_9FIRM|nr:AAA family ATPase [Heliophilum fasciatum]MCW2276906.1 transitional endoplasmic reticulum ATPase [Heliophilum fasciatum]TCP68634.1 transitional endoplasmic reticulum ATPase [Heliophilum fasciatum]
MINMHIQLHLPFSWSRQSWNTWRVARRHPSFTLTRFLQGRRTGQLTFSGSDTDLQALCQLWPLLSKGPEPAVTVNGEPLSFAQFTLVIGCLQEALRADDSRRHCNGGYQSSDAPITGTERFRPGCRYLIVDMLDAGTNGPRWYHCGHVDGNGVFHLDQDALLTLLHEQAEQRHCRLCPRLDWDYIRSQIKRLPATIDPRYDPTWTYRFAGTEVIGIERANPNSENQPIPDFFATKTEAAQPGATRPAQALPSRNGWDSSFSFEPVEPTQPISYLDVGGLKSEVRLMREAVELPFRYPDLIQTLGIKPPKGVLLYGPPGCGKTLLAQAVAQEVDARFFSVKGPEFLSSLHGQSEQRLRELFTQAEKMAPSIIFFDEIDAFAFDRNRATSSFEATLIAQFLSLMDGFTRRSQVVVIATTNRLDILDPALLRPGRFDYQIRVTLPDQAGRAQILQLHTRQMPIADDVDLDALAAQTEGYSGADLALLCAKAGLIALHDILGRDMDTWPATLDSSVTEQMQIEAAHWAEALSQIQPSTPVES